MNVAALPSVDAAPPPKTFSASYAKFSADDVLQVCMEYTMVGDFDGGKEDAETAWAKSTKPKDKSMAFVKRGCSRQFSDRTVLASCTVSKNKDAQAVTLNVNYYDFETVGLNDLEMKDCMNELKGEWDALPRDSKEWRAAKLEHAQRKLHKLTQ